jgi:hypothetical protein
MKQSFSFKENGRVYGCSFRRGNYSDTYFGRITEWRSEEDFKNCSSYNSVISESFNIALDSTTSKAAAAELKQYAYNNLISR